MLKVLLLSLISLLVIGCMAGKDSSVSSGRFQSVSEDKAIILQEGKDKTSCIKCGMDLPKFYKTNHAATHEGHTRQYCSIHCLVADLNEGNTLKNPQAVDLKSLKFIDASSAFYVVGSSKPSTMSHISKYVFKNKSDAEAFVKKFGGEIKDMYGAIDITQKDFR
ncbi:MAG: nitrous oxide reductase accessory protein NosL [Campylobacterota bacterium]|nr:nitrous oxide reductase accessory protein NosL [Campylobacterota bacterium]